MIENENRQYDLEVTAGHCSVNPERLDELYEISEITVNDGKGGRKRGLSFIRCVGVKSRSEQNHNIGMGIDSPVIEEAILTGSLNLTPPTVIIAERFVRETNMGIATEIMIPHIQMPAYAGKIPPGKLLAWNPSVQQLGWPIMEMAKFAGQYGWRVGIKNGKWLGCNLSDAATSETSIEKTWMGLATFAANFGCEVTFIHRGLDIPEKGDLRGVPVHEIVKRLAQKMPKLSRWFDPSHTYGPKCKNQIIKGTIEAMDIKVGNDFLYTGLLIEAGTSKTDTQQHLSIDELRVLLEEISKFRKLRGPF